MKRKIHLLILSISFPLLVLSQSTPQQMVAKMGRGINLGNTLSAPVEGNWAPAVEESYFDDIASVGFKTVRIPADFFGTRTSGDTSGYSKDANTASDYTNNPLTFTVSSTYLDRIEEVLTWALNRNLVVILDFHGSTLKDEFIETFNESKNPALYTHPTSAKRAADNAKFRAIWTQISNRLKNFSYDLLFEIINEPYFNITDIEMDVLNTDIINIIRSTGSNNADRNIVITGGSKNAYEAPLQIGSSVLSLDDNLIATYHYYWPRAFTASSSSQHTDYDWGTDADKLEVDTDFGAVKTWSTANNIPILFGEFGADNEGGYNYSTKTYGDFGGPENASRVEFHRYLAQKAIDLGFAFTVWDAGDQANKTIYKVTDRTWVSDVRNAVLGINCLDIEMIKNADIECGYNSNWNLYVANDGPVASISNTTSPNIYEDLESLKIEVTTAGTAHSKVVLKNEPYTQNISGKTYTFRTVAKGSTSSQNFKFRLKVTDNSDAVSYTLISNAFNLTTDYQLFEYTCDIPLNTKEVEFQILCGAKTGIYYFDNFNAFTNQTLSISNETNLLIEKVMMYPNPAKGNVFFKTTQEIVKIKVYDLTGSEKKCAFNKNTLDVSNLSTNVYFLQLFLSNSSQQHKKLVIINN
ncbi:T9SS C-terminal target domain-containing protein [Lutibacter sp. HS1-25]|uniref:cellulase family glycosylhydrolase n=1 Tax=Lutibacter sp. HS1-25 TaxID=2485000 RepID=UPI0010132C8C|nr:cellulase family glycosylhydrolase [Lutibacter sp. HS1-25]RXP44536.1 T9SS C-terminal target domain-containing protein [Lutibacter sp. HS1-25]